MWQELRHSSDWQFVVLAVPLMTVFQVIGPDNLRYQPDLIAQGQWWRLLSAHWVHLGWTHLLLNLAGLVICVCLTNPGWSGLRWLSCSLFIAIGISGLLLCFNPEVQGYAGFSGVLYGLYFLTALNLYKRDRLIAVLIIAALALKVLVEQTGIYDFDSSALIGAPVIVDAHFYGLLLAIAIALGWARYTMNHRPQTQSN